MKYMGRGEEGGGAPGCCDPLPSSFSGSLSSLHSSQSTGSSSGEINRSEQRLRREDIPPSPPPRYLPIFIQPFLSWRGIIPLQASEILGLGRDGVTTDRPKQGKPRWAKHGAPIRSWWVHQCALTMPRAWLPAPLHSARLHAAAAAATWPPAPGTASRIVIGGGEEGYWGGCLQNAWNAMEG